MSDTLLDLQNSWQQILLPCVGAISLVLIYVCTAWSSAPRPVLIDHEPVATKKEKTLAKKKQKQQLQKKLKSPTEQVAARAADPQPNLEAEPVKTKSPETKKPTKTQEKKSAAKQKAAQKPVAQKEDNAAEALLAATKKEKNRMKKEAQQGEWVTVVSSKEKKAKQVQHQAVESDRLAEEAKQAIIDEMKRLTAEAESKKSKPATTPSKGQPSAATTPSKDKSSASSTKSPSPEPTEAEASKSKSNNKKNTESAPTANIPESSSKPAVTAQPDVRPKDPKPAVAATTCKTGDQPVQSTGESGKTLQEKLADAMQPAFDEMEEAPWQEAKPLKMKNVKKRARREK